MTEARQGAKPVLIIGGGPVGLSMALALDRFGIPCTVIERSPTTTAHPRARGLSGRTMEIYRVWGIEEAVRSLRLAPYASVIQFCEHITGPFIGTTHPDISYSTAASRCLVAQDAIEAKLAEAIQKARHVDLRRRHELVDLSQDENGVTACVHNLETGEATSIRARYAIACDGASSRVRKALGIEMDGPAELARFANHYFKADLGHIPHTVGVLAYQVYSPDPTKAPAQFLPASADGTHFIYQQRLMKESDRALTDDQLIEFVRGHWGMPTLKVEPINVNHWRMSAQVARKFRDGNVFLAGDAAHRFPPTGGMGLNSGTQDVHNLAWKLAFVLRGIASARILDTYELERRPVAQSNTDWSVGNFKRLTRITEALHRRHEDPLGWREAIIDMDNHLHSEGQALGYIYEQGALIDDGEPPLPVDHRYYWPTDRPGARFPHMWQNASRTESTIDWFDLEFVMVCAPKATAWRAAGDALAAEGAPLKVKTLFDLGGPLSIAPDGAVLVRPDGHVAWRARSGAAAAQQTLLDALQVVLAGGVEAKAAPAVAPTGQVNA